MRVWTTIFIIGLSVKANALCAQSPVFSQFYTTGLYLNPALCGLEKDIYLGMNYRSQWSALDLPFNTFQFTYIHPFIKKGFRSKHMGGAGVSLLNDQAGPNNEFTTQSISLAATYNFHLSKYGNNIIAVALQAAAAQRKINFDPLQWSSQYSTSIGYDNSLNGESTNINDRVLYPVINAGVIWHITNKERLPRKRASLFQGISASNINKPRGFFEHEKDALAILYKVHGGFLATLSNNLEISPNYIIQYQDVFQFNVGAYGSYTLNHNTMRSKMVKVALGGWYRFQDAFIFTTGFSNTYWNIGFSYDTNTTSLRRNLGKANAYEISLAYKILIKKFNKSFSSPLI